MKTYHFVPDHPTTVEVIGQDVIVRTTYPDGYKQSRVFTLEELQSYALGYGSYIETDENGFNGLMLERLGAYVKRRVRHYYVNPTEEQLKYIS